MRQHSLLLTILTSLAVVAGVSNVMLRADLTGGNPGAAPSFSTSEEISDDFWRACSSTGTLFERLSRPDDVMERYRATVNTVMNERWDLLNDSSLWQCYSPDGFAEPSMPVLTGLAEEMPGWYYKETQSLLGVPYSTFTLKPVTWENFSSILMEFQREYECKLSELQEHTVQVVLNNDDIQGPFCCLNSGDICSVFETPDSCNGGKFIGFDSQCGGDCQTGADATLLGFRLANHKRRMFEERQRSRTAIERAMTALRSFEIHLPFTLHMTCLQRATLDLRNELALTADAISCMPKIWDSVTSLHDPLQ